TGAAFVFGAVETGCFVLLVVYGREAGYPVEQAVLLGATMTLGNVFGQIPLGILSDRMDRRVLLMGMSALAIVMALLMPGAASSFPLLAADLFILGAFTGGFYTVGLALLGARFSGAALAQTNAAFIFSFASGTLFGPTLIGFGIE